MKYLVKVIFNINQECLSDRLKEYTFASYEEVLPGDVVVVDTRNGFQLVTVTELTEKLPDFLSNDALKEVVCKVDFSKFIQRQEKRERAKTIKAEMDKKVKVIQSQVIYEMLAEKDPELKALFNEYKRIFEE